MREERQMREDMERDVVHGRTALALKISDPIRFRVFVLLFMHFWMKSTEVITCAL